MQMLLETAIYGFAFWLGLYLISRNPADKRLMLAGAGLVAYAIGIGFDMLIIHATDSGLAARLTGWQRPFLFLPAIFWAGLLLRLAPQDMSLGIWLKRHPRPLAVIMAATIFFALGLGFWFFPLAWLPRHWLLVGIGLDLLLLGFVVAVLDAFDEGQALLPHLLRSLVYTFLTVLLFGGQVALVMALSTGVTLSMLVLLLSTMAVATFLQTFSDPLQRVLDSVAFLNFPRIRRAQAALQTEAAAATRLDDSLDLASMDEVEFARLTRRALSHLGDLPKLAASPLTRLRLVDARLAQNGQAGGTLARANTLKMLLSESILRLKPQGQGDFGTADAWRYFNALYYPYVRGLKPYRRRLSTDPADESLRRAADWFRAEVPQRTLYNWQNAAAKLIAQDLRERSRNPA